VSSEPDRRARRTRAVLVLGGWTGVGVATSAMLWFQGLDHTLADPLNVKRVARILVDVWMWAAYTPVVFQLARRLPLSASSWRANLPVHVLCALAAAVIDSLVALWISPWLGPYRANTFLAFFTRTASISVYCYVAVLTLGHALEYHRLWTDHRLRAAELERQVAETRLGVLEAQLRPHFLFNALHTVGSLVRAGEQSAAVSAIARLGDLLRQALRGGSQQEVTLREELIFATHYLELERARFRDRLETRVDVEPALLDALVPRFILQPLVENAVRHGIEPSEHPGRVEVSAARSGDSLHLAVTDTGPGPIVVRSGRGGIGLGNTRERLRHLYGPAASVDLEARPGGGSVVRVVLPYHAARGEVAA